VNRTHRVLWLALVALVAEACTGCSWFHHRTDYYNKATETRPLEVPPDLDAPATSTELVVPPTSGAVTPASPQTNAAPPEGLATGATAAAPSTILTAGGLHVADTPEHTWQRVGLALERAQVGTISARDESAHSYTLEVAGLAATQPVPAPQEHHWYTRILHPFGGGNSAAPAQQAPVSGHLTVTVTEDSGGARVNVEGNASDSAATEAARRVLEALRERLS